MTHLTNEQILAITAKISMEKFPTTPSSLVLEIVQAAAEEAERMAAFWFNKID